MTITLHTYLTCINLFELYDVSIEHHNIFKQNDDKYILTSWPSGNGNDDYCNARNEIYLTTSFLKITTPYELSLHH